ncbi:MAG: hypothetical protein PWR13_790 [Archaeoglobi archaeon]|nr:hypothetical protein [Archaeoglobi archaeon]
MFPRGNRNTIAKVRLKMKFVFHQSCEDTGFVGDDRNQKNRVV